MTRNHSLFYLFGSLIYFASRTAGNESLVGGTIAKDNDFRYHVSIQKPQEGHVCGGAIIDDQFIITAAHCVVELDNQINQGPIFVIAGTYNLRNIVSPAIIGHVQKVYIPNDYDVQSTTAKSDIAVLKLTESMQVWKHKNLRKLKLPGKRDKDYAGKTAVMAGFGRYSLDNKHKAQVSDELRFSEADILTNEQCQEGYKLQKIIDNQLCARVKQYSDDVISGACLGDSGSPIVVKGKTIVGVLSRGPAGCTEKVRAGIYTRITSYLDFIEHAMKDDKNDSNLRSQVIRT